MQRKMLKILMALCLVLCLAPAALAESDNRRQN